jgi:hypothetical protein
MMQTLLPGTTAQLLPTSRLALARCLAAEADGGADPHLDQPGLILTARSAHLGHA